MNVNEFAKDVHENAVAHGWWDTARSFPEVAALIHSEVSEALEEWRDGNPAIYGCCGIPGAVCEFEGACDKGEKTGTCKPEGVAVELCDAVIRILITSPIWAWMLRPFSRQSMNTTKGASIATEENAPKPRLRTRRASYD